MTIGVALNESSIALKEESTEGIYTAEAAGSDFLEVLPEIEIVPSKDLIDREVLSSDVEKVAPRVGQKSVTAAIPVELKAAPNASVGEAPETDLLYKGLMGGRRQKTTQTTTGASHTSTVINIDDDDITDFKVGDIVKILEAGAFEARPISVVTRADNASSITLAFALDNGAPGDNVVIEKFTTYFPSSVATAAVAETYVVTFPATAGATQADYFMIYDDDGNSTAVNLDIDANGTTPTGALYAAADSTIEVDIVGGGTAINNATLAFAALNGNVTNVSFTDNLDGTLTIVMDNNGPVPFDAVPKDEDDSGAGSIAIGTITKGVLAVAASPTLSATYYIGGEIRQKAIGLRVVSGTLNNFSTNQVANMAFALEGLDWEREDGSELFAPSFDGNEPPVVLEACIWLNGVKVDTNEFGLSIENEVGFLTSTCSANGKISSRITGFKVTGNFNPYMDDTSVTRFDSFRDNDDNTLFVSISEPSGTTGEDKEFVSFWIPKMKIVEAPIGDQEGIATDALAFQAFKTLGGDTLFIGMS